MRSANDPALLPVAVIGGGFSGSAAALQLFRHQPGRRVLLCDGGPGFGQGVAYAAFGFPNTWLNVPAHNMSLYPDRPDHFSRWLLDRGCRVSNLVVDSPVGTFATRDLYGRYLAGELLRAISTSDGANRLMLVRDEVVDLVPKGAGFEMLCASGRSHDVAAAILAVGNLTAPPAGTIGRCVHAWSPRALDGLDPDQPILVMGTGLTMVDVAVALDAQGFRAPIIAFSRRGLLPRSHERSSSWPTPEFSTDESRSVLRLVRRIRREISGAQAQGVGWRSVIDSLRPITPRIWSNLSPQERSRFLRHLRPWWDVHRHRMPPPAVEAVRRMIAQERLLIRRGRVASMTECSERVTVALQQPGKARSVTLRVQRVIDASGLAHVSDVRDPLIQRLLERGLLKLDVLGIGIHVNEELVPLTSGGEPSANLWALGPIVRGVFWECTAVPDVRRQAQQLASLISRSLSR